MSDIKPPYIPSLLWQTFSSRGTPKRLAPNELLWTPGSNFPEHKYVVTSGLLRLYHVTSSGNGVTLLTVSAGGFLGQHTDAATENQMTGAEALCETELLFLPLEQTSRWLSQKDDVGRLFAGWIYDDLVAQLRDTQLRFSLEHDTALVCVVHALLVLDHLNLLERMSRQQIATVANLTVETTVRVISKLLREGHLASSRFTTLSDKERLTLADLLEPYELSNSPYG